MQLKRLQGTLDGSDGVETAAAGGAGLPIGAGTATGAAVLNVALDHLQHLQHLLGTAAER